MSRVVVDLVGALSELSQTDDPHLVSAHVSAALKSQPAKFSFLARRLVCAALWQGCVRSSTRERARNIASPGVVGDQIEEASDGNRPLVDLDGKLTLSWDSCCAVLTELGLAEDFTVFLHRTNDSIASLLEPGSRCSISTVTSTSIPANNPSSFVSDEPSHGFLSIWNTLERLLQHCITHTDCPLLFHAAVALLGQNSPLALIEHVLELLRSVSTATSFTPAQSRTLFHLMVVMLSMDGIPSLIAAQPLALLPKWSSVRILLHEVLGYLLLGPWAEACSVDRSNRRVITAGDPWELVRHTWLLLRRVILNNSNVFSGDTVLKEMSATIADGEIERSCGDDVAEEKGSQKPTKTYRNADEWTSRKRVKRKDFDQQGGESASTVSESPQSLEECVTGMVRMREVDTSHV